MEKQDLIAEGYIPLDKSWIIRMGVLDLLTGREDTINFLAPLVQKSSLSSDLKSLYIASISWQDMQRNIYVGESGTLYRFLQFADWKLGGGREFGTKGTLTDRKEEMCQDPNIVNLSLEQLLDPEIVKDDTSQWASAAVICAAALGYDIERIETEKPKLNLTYEAVDYWKEKREKGESWEERYDDTLAEQVLAYLNLLKTGEMKFGAKQAEDYCFARAFNVITEDEVEYYSREWSSLHEHESDRIEEMEKCLGQYRAGKIIDSRDHRVVQAIAMLANYEGKEASFKYRNCVSKSWWQFWKFLDNSKGLAE